MTGSPRRIDDTPHVNFEFFPPDSPQKVKTLRRIGEWLAGRFKGLDHDTPNLVPTATAPEQCQELAAVGVGEFHLYTLNRADLVFAICHMLGLRPRPVAP
ncbi:MAG TPA: methylenetetrahydrofolate reductase [Alphaproteobacteria bacterium]|jgi:methylenetetrahydrofolate reductase (NADPH)|nr:methylenetetrahydrofolate reductase [Alphaproteobacteria bacterium]|tara:strand:+ start:349 stop:648 length:300 start_codon:yes stop_codon:yes gene_type:complete